MGIEYIDGFEYVLTTHVTQRWPTTAGNYSTDTDAGRKNRGLILSNGYVHRRIGAERNRWVVGAAFRFRLTQNTSIPIMQWIRSATGGKQTTLSLRADRRLEVRRGDGGGPVISTSSTSQTLNIHEWYYIEWDLNLDDTFGVSRVYVNGSLWMNPQPPLDTALVGPLVADSLRLGYQNNNNYYDFTFNYDDLYVKSIISEPEPYVLGSCHVSVKAPDADTGTNQWYVGGTAAHYDAVDQVPNDDTDYVSPTGLNQLELYSITPTAPDISATATIHTVQANIVSKATSGRGEKTRFRFLLNGNQYASGVNHVSTVAGGYAAHTETFENNPDTNNKWTPDDIDGGQFGMEYTGSSGPVSAP